MLVAGVFQSSAVLVTTCVLWINNSERESYTDLN